MPDEAALAAEFLLTDNPNLHSVFPQHHASFLPPELRGDAFVKEVAARRALAGRVKAFNPQPGDRKSTRLNSSHVRISYAVFCFKKKKQESFPQSLKSAELKAPY